MTFSWTNRSRKLLAPLTLSLLLASPGSAQPPSCGIGNAWQETESGFTAHWRREGPDGRFVADYTAPDGHKATTHNQVTLNGGMVQIRRLNSSDSTTCIYTGTLSGATIAGSYSCPGSWAGQRPWRATILCGPVALPPGIGTAPPQLTPAQAAQILQSMTPQEAARLRATLDAAGNSRR